MKKRPQSRPKPVIPHGSVKGTNPLPDTSQTRGKIRLKFGRLNMNPSSSNPNLRNKNPVLPNRHAMGHAAQLLMPRQGKREQPRPPLKKNGWVSQRIKPFPVELPSVYVKEGKKRDKPEQRLSLTFDDLPKIRDKVAQAREVHFKRLRETKSKDSEEHWKSLGPNDITSNVLRNYFRLSFNAYTPYVTISLA